MVGSRPMTTGKLRPLVLPAALAVSSFALTPACSDDETLPHSSLPDCADVAADDCTKCVDGQGNVTCAGEPSEPGGLCLYDSATDACDEAVA